MPKEDVLIRQSVAILVDGNNIERSLHNITGDNDSMVNFDALVPRLVGERSLNRLIYFREGRGISGKLAERLHEHYYGLVVPCHKSADIPLTIYATQIADKVDTVIILSGDSDYVELLRHLRSRGVRIEIAAVRETTATILLEECDFFHPIIGSDTFTLRSGKPVDTRPPSRQQSPQGRTTDKDSDKDSDREKEEKPAEASKTGASSRSGAASSRSGTSSSGSGGSASKKSSSKKSAARGSSSTSSNRSTSNSSTASKEAEKKGKTGTTKRTTKSGAKSSTRKNSGEGSGSGGSARGKGTRRNSDKSLYDFEK